MESHKVNKKELIKTMQTEFDNGDTLSNIYEKHKGEDISEKKFAILVASLKDNNLILKHKIANKVLIFVMVLVTIFTAIAGYGIGVDVASPNPIYWCAVAIIPMIFLYNFVKVNYQAYLAYVLLSIIQFPKSLENFGAELVTDIIGVVLSLFLIALVWYLKNKIFPYMGFFGVKKDANKQYAFVRGS